MAALLGRRFPPDAQAALAAPIGAAIFMCASPLVDLGIPTRPLLAGVIVLFGALTLASRRHLLAGVRAAAIPACLALTALLLISAPAVARGSWEAAAVDNTDPYLWVSQATAFLEGPPPAPATDFPDRLAYERIGELHWPVGLPFGVAAVALLADDDPARVYGAFAALLVVLLSLVVYGCARACLGWRRRFAAIAAIAVTANAYVVYSTFNGWQAQLALTVFGTLCVFGLGAALDREALAREQVLVGLSAAAALATYGILFAPFAGLAGVVALVCLIRRARTERRRNLAVIGGSAVATVALGLVPLVHAGLQLSTVMRSRDNLTWHLYAHGLPAEALGLIPRIGTAHRPALAWSVIALVTAAALLAFGLSPGRLRSARGADVLLIAGGLSLLAIGFLQLPGISPYLSMKVVGYTTPILTLVAVNGLIGDTRLRRLRVAFVAAASCLFVFSTAIVMTVDVPNMAFTKDLATMRSSLIDIPKSSRIALGVDDEWRQTWAVYYLRDRPLVVTEPNIFLTGFGLQPRSFAKRPAEYVLEESSAPGGLWRGNGLVLREAVQSASSKR